MAAQKDLDIAYLTMADTWSHLSKASRKCVGCLIVKDGQIISDGFNGTPTGFKNACEDEDGFTRKEVLHAESNAITKLAKSTQSGDGATIYITCSPCFECAKLIIQAGIKRVVYAERYRIDCGLSLLRKAAIDIKRYSDLFSH